MMNSFLRPRPNVRHLAVICLLICAATVSHAHRVRDHDDDHGSDRVSIAHDSVLPAGQQADAVVSILGSSTSDGESVDVVSVLGSTRVTGNAHGDAVSVVGSTYVDGKVDGDAVAVMGDVELGPHAEVGGDVVTVLGTVRRDPAAIVHGGVQSVFDSSFAPARWLKAWIDHCLLWGRPLAPVPDVAWAWGVALCFLAFYAVLALLFPATVNRCVQTFDTHAGRSLLAAIIAALLMPVLIVLLCVTVVGVAALPLIGTALLGAGLFGRAVMLAWLGSRLISGLGTSRPAHPALAVLTGGALVLALYLVPAVGFLVFQLIGILGFGTVVYTSIVALQDHRAGRLPPRGPDGTTTGMPPFGAPGTAAGEGSSFPGAATVGGGAFPGAAAAVPPFPGAATAAVPPFPGAAAAAAVGAAASATGAADIADPAAGATTAQSPPFGAAGAAVSPTAAAVLATLPRAGFWLRMAALLLDVVLVGFVVSVLNHAFHLHLLVLAAYGAVMWKLRGSTVGGIVCDLRVVRVDGRELDWQTAIVRALACFLSLAVAGLGFIWIVVDHSRQGWHDKIAGTVVVRVPRAAPLV